jgi:hypothetical protein
MIMGTQIAVVHEKMDSNFLKLKLKDNSLFSAVVPSDFFKRSRVGMKVKIHISKDSNGSIESELNGFFVGDELKRCQFEME